MAVVLIPGFMMDRDLWTDIESALVPYGPLHYADMSGGDSIAEMAQAILQTAPEEFILVGFSMGGYIAREIARLAPLRVSELILICTSSKSDQALEQARTKLSDISAQLFNGISRRSIKHSLGPASQEDASLVDRIRAMSVRLGGEVFRKQAALSRRGDTDLLRQIKARTLVVAGRHDNLRSLAESEVLNSHIPNSTLITLDAGHVIPLEAPQELMNAMRDFLSDRFSA